MSDVRCPSCGRKNAAGLIGQVTLKCEKCHTLFRAYAGEPDKPPRTMIATTSN